MKRDTMEFTHKVGRQTRCDTELTTLMIQGPGTNWLRPTDITGHSHTHRTHIDIYYLIMSPDTCLYIQYIPIPPHTEFIPIPGIHPPLLIKLLFDLSPPYALNSPIYPTLINVHFQSTTEIRTGELQEFGEFHF